MNSEANLNVLLTCAGRRNYLVGWFREALAGLGRVCCADVSPEAPALYEADVSLAVPPCTDPDYPGVLLDLCRRHQVGLLIPLSDMELPVLSSLRGPLQEIGVFAVVSTPEVIDVCLDKWRMCLLLQRLGLRAPHTYLSLTEARAALARGEVSFPLVVKPRWGAASTGIEVAQEAGDLDGAYYRSQSAFERTGLTALSCADPKRHIIVQEFLTGPEYGLDVINDLSGRHVAVFPRRKLAMRAGETDRAVTVADDRFVALGSALGPGLGHIGCLDCDVFFVEEQAVVLDLNPRFGGGYPFSHIAGANLPAALLAWASGGSVDPGWLAPRPGVVSAKCERLVICPEPAADGLATVSGAAADQGQP